MSRDELIDLLYAQTPLFVTRESFAHSLHEWDIQPVHVDGELAFITVVRGPEFHFQSMGTKHIISMRMIREFLKPIMARHGYATTKTPKLKEYARQHRFNRKIGFVPFHEDVDEHHYRIDRLPHV